MNIKQIENYLYKNDNKTNKILFKLFHSFISLYLKCSLCFPLIKIEYTKEFCNYEPKSMFDLISKKGAKNKIVNFCYIPALISNGRFVNNAKFYVLTFIEGKTYFIKEIAFNQAKISQKYSYLKK